MAAHETNCCRHVFIGVGSNIEPERNIAEALGELGRVVTVTDTSTFYWTEPLKGRKQDNYLNGVWLVETAIPGRDLKFDILRSIERKLHRERTGDTWDSRTMDLDVVLYGDMVIREQDMTVPDPDIYDRPFLALPIAELAPDLIVPDSGKCIRDIAAVLDTTGLKPNHIFTASLKRSIPS